MKRQTHLLRHLTSEAFIFGTGGLSAAAGDPDLRGVDIGRLRLEAEFSYNKRIKRIRQTFERTAALLGHGFSAITREFAALHPPETYERHPDAQRFFDHFMGTLGSQTVHASLGRGRGGRGVDPVPCPDAPAHDHGSRRPWRNARASRPLSAIAPIHAPCWCVAGTTCVPLFEPGRSGAPVTQRQVCLAVLASRGRRRPTVMELAPEAFALLERSTEWSAPEPAVEAMARDLAAQGLVLACGNHG